MTYWLFLFYDTNSIAPRMHFYRDAFMFFEKSPLANIVKIWFLLNLLDNRIRCVCVSCWG